MRILTQNILMCNIKNCIKKEIPLTLIVNKSEIIESEFNADLVKKTLLRMNWKHLVETAKLMGEENLPVELKMDLLENMDFLKNLHNILFQFHVVEGSLVCKECKREYVVKNGIPNMLLEDDE